METVFKKTFTKPLPFGAELFTRVTASKEGEPHILIEAKTYTAKYRDGARVVREVSTGCRDEQAARSVLVDLERRAELVEAGVMATSEDEIAGQQSTSLADHFTAFDAALQSKGRTKVYRENIRRALSRLAADFGFVRLSDLRRETLEKMACG